MLKFLTVSLLLFTSLGAQAQTAADKAEHILRRGGVINEATLPASDRESVLAELRKLATAPNGEWRERALTALVDTNDLETIKWLVSVYEGDQFVLRYKANRSLGECSTCALVPLVIADVFKEEPMKFIHEEDIVSLPRSFTSTNLIFHVLSVDPTVSAAVRQWASATGKSRIEERATVRRFWTANQAAILAGQYGALVVPP